MKPQVAILGAGAQAREVIDVFEQAGTHEIVGVVAGEPPEGGAVYGYPHLGDDGVLPGLLGRGIGHAFVGVGDNRVRLGLIQRLRALGFELPNAISPRAYVSPHARLGVGIVVMHGAVVSVGAEIGDGVILNHSSVVGHDARLGRGVHIAAALIGARAEIGEGTNVWPRATVTLGVRVGAWATIGAGSLLLRDVPARTTVAGLPGRWVVTAAEGA